MGKGLGSLDGMTSSILLNVNRLSFQILEYNSLPLDTTWTPNSRAQAKSLRTSFEIVPCLFVGLFEPALDSGIT